MSLQSLSWDWQFEPTVIVGIALAALLYWRGALYSMRAGLARHLHWWRYLAFAGGLLMIVLALESPIDAWADTYLWAHMLQHMLLIFAAAPLLLFGAPIWPIWRAVPLPARRSSLRWLMLHRRARRLTFGLNHLLTAPRVVWALFVGDFLIWHVSLFYDLALRNQNIHNLEHLLFLGTALLFWAQVIPSVPFRPRLSYGWQAAYTFTAAFVTSLVAMVYIYSSAPLYPYYAALPRPAGSIPVMVDQDAAGALMEITCGIIFGVVFMTLLGLWLGEDERKTREMDERRQRDLIQRAGAPHIEPGR